MSVFQAIQNQLEVTATNAVLGILLALLARRAGNGGQDVDVSIVESVFGLMEGCLPECLPACSLRSLMPTR